MYLGFSASCGGLNNIHAIKDIYYNNINLLNDKNDIYNKV